MIPLTKTAETASTITLSWTPVPGCVGYRFSAENQPKYSHTFDPTRSSVKFAKGSSWYRVEALGVEDAGTYPQAPATTWDGPTAFSQDGVVEGRNFESSGATPAVSILTSQPLTFRNCGFRNLSGPGTAYIVDAYHGTPNGAQLVFENCRVYGGTTYDKSPRWLVAKEWRSIVVRNCTIESTRGMEFWPNGQSGSVLTITRNRHLNVLGGATLHTLAYVGNFVQLREVLNTAIEISWNEIVNEYGKSEPEDVISIYHTNRAHVFDNMLRGHTMPGNSVPGSFGGITIDGSDAEAVGCVGNVIERNQLVDGMGIVAAVQHAGSDNAILDNRIIADQFIPGGALKRAGYSGLAITPGPGSGNHAHGNLVGYMGVDPNNWPGSGGFRSDGDLSGADDGNAAEWARNTHLGHNPTQADEDAEWTFWQAKLAAAGIVIGASA